MRTPWIEAGPLLAAAGVPPLPKNYRPTIWSHHAMQPAPYALLRRLNAVTKPIIFPDANALAAYIERLRGGQGLELVEIEDLHFLWRAEGGGQGVDAPEVRDIGIQVWTTDLGNNRDRCLGWAWLNGGGMEVLRAAMRRAADRPAHGVRSLGQGGTADSSARRSRDARSRLLGLGAVA